MKNPAALGHVVFVIALSSLIWAGCREEKTIVGSPNVPALSCSEDSVMHFGEATYYTFASGAGACMFDSTPNDLMVGAMNLTDYGISDYCGACVSIVGPKGEIIVRIVDLCPECLPGDIDLSPLAFSLIADLPQGRVPIKWKVVSCNISGPIQYHFKDGSNPWWTAVQIRNHRYPIKSVEYFTNLGVFKNIVRTNYNYFVETSGMGPGPFVFRVTDVFDHTLVDSGIVHIENGTVLGRAQFPGCLPY